MLVAKNNDYKVKRQTSRHWRALLAATASEITSQGSTVELRSMMVRIGYRFASHTTMPDGETLDDYEKFMCAVWADMDWGWVELRDSGDALHITHHSSTNGLLSNGVFNKTSEEWVSGFLEGVYQQWVSRMGAGEKLRVKQAS